MWAKVGMALAALVVFATAAPVSAQTKLTGVVSDAEGAAIQGARIFIHWDPAGSGVGLTSNMGIKQDIMLITNASGSFSTDLPSGFYDVFVSATAFSPDCRKIRLNAGQKVTLNAKLNVSPLVIRELGDIFK